ncbi:hypothetical protein DPMN_050970 [Dreissena polymorpha]|uniref:Uncharacterized protein n=1 Tax=Dreissena polymorpha TaxID=45954 RepID=A0A9D4CIJ7_DREPO|nr:hypothetical protein DPMN_050970 [Dreissena polymorpha]
MEQSEAKERDYIKSELKLNESAISIERAHRLPGNNYPRPVIVSPSLRIRNELSNDIESKGNPIERMKPVMLFPMSHLRLIPEVENAFVGVRTFPSGSGRLDPLLFHSLKNHLKLERMHICVLINLS